MKRFFVNKNLQLNKRYKIEGVEHNHLKNVLRLSEGDEIILQILSKSPKATPRLKSYLSRPIWQIQSQMSQYFKHSSNPKTCL